VRINYKQNFLVGVLALAVALITTVAYAADLIQPIKTSDEQLLTGRWLRPDGGYILELSEIKKDGKLKAVYLNPKPINVSQAEWSRNEGKINIFVKLQDVNYPGSTYTLQYDPTADTLKGTYFHAILQETFAIEFVRIK